MSDDAPEQLPVLALTGSNVDGVHFRVAVRTRQGIVCAQPSGGERGDLARLVQQACGTALVRLADLCEVRTDRGPGSYIGLRVALTFARTLCAFGGPRLRSVDTLQLIAAAALEQAPELRGSRLVPVLDGRKGRLHAAVLRCGSDGVLAPVLPPMALPPDALQQRLEPEDVVLLPPTLWTALAPMVTAARARTHGFPRVGAEHLFSPRLALETADLLTLEPLYLMGSYVDRENDNQSGPSRRSGAVD